MDGPAAATRCGQAPGIRGRGGIRGADRGSDRKPHRQYRSCMPTATSTQPCQYGFVPGTTVGTNNSPVANLNNTLFGTMTFTPTELDGLIQSALYTKDYRVLRGLSGQGRCPDAIGRISTRPSSPRPFPQQAFDLHCMKHCMANNGSVYEQPHFAYNELTDAGYFMFDFEQPLMWEMIFNGNIGARYVKTDDGRNGLHDAGPHGSDRGLQPDHQSRRRRHHDGGAQYVARERHHGLAAGLQPQSLGHARRAGAPLLPGRGDDAPDSGSLAALGNLHHRRTQ